MRDSKTPPTDRFTPPDEGGWDRYLAGECGEDERRAIEVWLRDHPDDAVVVGRTVYVASYPVKGMRQTTAAKAFESFERNRAVAGEPYVSLGRGIEKHALRKGLFKTQPLRRTLWLSVATFVFGLALLLVGWNAGIRHRSSGAARSNLAYTTGNGERATITLPDGGTVVLNVASRLEIPMDYMANNHTLRLIGEGLFTIPHHQRTPVTVLAGVTAVRVLGTSFVVRQYPTDTTTMVAVREGKVSVGPVVVTASRMVEVGRTSVPSLEVTDASPFTFATGVLTLNALPLSSAIVDLDRWYDADIRLGSSALATKQITGDFAAGSLADLTGLLEFTMNVRVVRVGRVLTLYPK